MTMPAFSGHKKTGRKISALYSFRQSSLKQRHDHQGDDIDDLDQRINSWAGGIFVRVTHGIAGHSSIVCFRTFAAEVAFLDIFLRVVPCTATSGHGKDSSCGVMCSSKFLHTIACSIPIKPFFLSLINVWRR